MPRLVCLGEDRSNEDAWVCPICCQSLATRQEEIGALTFRGHRLEKALYHGGCVSMMLLHGGHQSSQDDGAPTAGIRWGVSPVSRQSVDGFLLMPSPTSTQKWLDFFDWRGNGQFDILDIVFIVTHVFPVHASTIRNLLTDQSVNEELHDVPLSRKDVEQKLVPFLVTLCRPETLLPAQPTCARPKDKQLLQARTLGDIFADLRHVMDTRFDHWLALRSTCVIGCTTARLLFLHELCWFVECPRLELHICYIVNLVFGFARKGDSSAILMGLRLLNHPEIDVRVASCKLLCSIASERDRRPMLSLIPLLADANTTVRDASKEALQKLATNADRKVMLAACSFVQERASNLKASALVAFKILAERGDRCAVDSAVSLLKDDDKMVRLMACKTLPFLAHTGDKQSRSALISCLGDADSQVQVAAFQSLPSIALQGDRQVVREMISVLKRVRKHCTATMDARGQLPLVCLLECGVKTLGQFAQGDEQALELCRSMQTNCHPRIMSAAKLATTQLSISTLPTEEPATPIASEKRAGHWSWLRFWRCGRRFATDDMNMV